MRTQKYTKEEIKEQYALSDAEWIEVFSLIPESESKLLSLHAYQVENLLSTVTTMFKDRTPLGWAAIGLVFPGFFLYVEQSLRNVGGGATRRLYQRLDNLFDMPWDDTYLALREISRIHGNTHDTPSIIDMKRLLSPYLVIVREYGKKAIPFIAYYHYGLEDEVRGAIESGLDIDIFESIFYKA